MRGLLGSLLAPASTGEAKMSSRDLLRIMSRGSMSRAGERVTWERALQVTTMLACARVLADGVAQVPWKVHLGGPGRMEARDHPLYDLLYRRPNAWQTSFEFRETLMFHTVLGGNAFLQKLRVGSARRLAALEPFEPGYMRVEQDENRRLRYFHRPEGSGSEREYPAEDVWHVRGPSWNSWIGLDITRLAREAIGLSLATESAHADLHKGGARVSGIYTVKPQLTKEKFEQLAAWMDQYRAGGPREGETLLLDNEAKFEKTQMSGVDAEHLETRRYQVEEICRPVRVMPIMIGQSNTPTYASAEQLFLAHVVHCLMPWYERLEQSADVNLLTTEERAAGLYTKFNPNALMRGAAKDRGDFYAKALGAGGTPAWMTQDEVRGLEELPPRGGPADELSRGAMNPGPGAAPEDEDDNAEN
jgi:HK97 family phage portal protein